MLDIFVDSEMAKCDSVIIFCF